MWRSTMGITGMILILGDEVVPASINDELVEGELVHENVELGLCGRLCGSTAAATVVATAAGHSSIAGFLLDLGR